MPRTLARLLLAIVVTMAVGTWGCDCDRGPRITTAAELFSRRVVPRLDIAIEEEALARLHAKPETGPDGKKRKRKFVKARVTHKDRTLEEVGVRIKGNRSARDAESKPGLKLSFDKYVKGQRLWGLARLTLNNLAEDPTHVRETLAYMLHREAGVPAPRTGFVDLFINGERRGLYVALEAFDDDFFTDRFGEGGSSALVYEGEFGCDLQPEDVDGFERDNGDDPSRSALRALAEAASRPAAAEPLFFSDDAPLDTPRVLAYLAVSALVGDFDGYRHAHNYRIARHPGSGRWLFLPWGLDRTFKKRLSVIDSGGIVAKLCFSDPRCVREYARAMGRVLEIWERLDLESELRTLAELLAPHAEREADPRFPKEKREAARRVLYSFLRARGAQVRAWVDCLDGDRELDRDGDGAGCLDCDDRDAQIHPGAREVCGDRIDQDCSGTSDDAPECGCPGETIGGVSFAFCENELAWPEAAEFCRAMGMHLARIDGAGQAKAVAEAARRRDRTSWWIGLSDRGAEGVFVWEDGTRPDYTRWGRGQPDNDPCNEDCAAIRRGKSGSWQDSHCGQRRPFICR